MNKKIVNPVNSSTKKQTFDEPKLHKSDLLSIALKKKGLEITLGQSLKGGFVSQIYEAELNDNGEKVVVKHTEDLIPFDPTEIFIGKEGHNTDTYVLKLLQDSKKVRVPKIKHHFSDITTTIMEDLRESGFELLSDLIANGVLPKIGSEIGLALAHLNNEAKNWTKFETNLSAYQNAYERGLELRLSYPNTQKEYLELEMEFTTNNTNWSWLDGHPKNIFVNKSGELAFIDFGNSSFCDQRFVLPNFLAHIVIFSLTGYYSLEQTIAFVKQCINSYKSVEEIDEPIFCKYLGMEVLHRTNGKWLSGVDTMDQKIALHKFGLTIFDNNIDNIKSLLELLKK